VTTKPHAKTQFLSPVQICL